MKIRTCNGAMGFPWQFPRGASTPVQVKKLTVLLCFAFAGLSASATYTPDGNAPTSLVNHMPSTWDLSSVTNRIWVDDDGPDGDGTSESYPFRSIQDAVDTATPGTVILVKAGTYYENVTIGKDNAANGTATAPILIVSADGPHQAIVQSSGDVTTFNGFKRSNWGIVGFKIVGSGYKADTGEDASPVKIGGNYSDTTRHCNNWFVAGNYIDGQGHDGTKFYSGRNIFWIGNTYDVDVGEEICDHVAVGVQDVNGDDNQFGFNTILSTTAAPNTAMTLKMGTNNYLIFNNQISYTHATSQGLGVKLGGNGTSTTVLPSSSTDPDFYPKTANKVQVLYNLFDGAYGKNVIFYGAQNCTVSYNNLDNPNLGNSEISDQYGNVYSGYSIEPLYNTVTNNKIASSTDNDFTHAGHGSTDILSDESSTYTISGNNHSVTFNYPVGASYVEPLITDLIYYLRYGNEDLIQRVYNADFESGDNGDWVIMINTAIQSSVTYGSSGYAASITPNGNFRKIYQEIPVYPGETFTAACAMKIVGFDGVQNAKYQVRFYDTDAEGTYSGTTTSPYQISIATVADATSTVNDDWETFTLNDIVAPDDADFIRIWICANQSTTGTVYFDDVMVWSSDVLPGTELLADGDFDNENGNGDWFIHSSASIDTDGGIDGSPAIWQPATSGYSISWQEVDLNGASVVNAASYIQTYNLASGYKAYYQVRFLDSSGNTIDQTKAGEVFDSTSAYAQYINVNIPVPAGAVTAKAYLGVSGGSQGGAWFDEIQLKAVP